MAFPFQRVSLFRLHMMLKPCSHSPPNSPLQDLLHESPQICPAFLNELEESHSDFCWTGRLLPEINTLDSSEPTPLVPFTHNFTRNTQALDSHEDDQQLFRSLLAYSHHQHPSDPSSMEFAQRDLHLPLVSQEEQVASAAEPFRQMLKLEHKRKRGRTYTQRHRQRVKSNRHYSESEQTASESELKDYLQSSDYPMIAQAVQTFPHLLQSDKSWLRQQDKRVVGLSMNALEDLLHHLIDPLQVDRSVPTQSIFVPQLETKKGRLLALDQLPHCVTNENPTVSDDTIADALEALRDRIFELELLLFDCHRTAGPS